MFCHDGSTIFYPTAPGRVYSIGIAALADCSGSDEDLSDSTRVGDIRDIVNGMPDVQTLQAIGAEVLAPGAWPRVHHVVDGDVSETPDLAATDEDFNDALEQWADWCDRDSARLDSLDEIMGAIERAA
jgi:hypothetical protein